MNNWNGIDFFIFLIFAVNTMLGMSRGASREIISIMGLSVALIITIKFTVPLAAFFNSSPLMTSVVSTGMVQNFMKAIGAGPLTVGLLKQVFYCISLLLCFAGGFSLCEAVMSYSGFVSTLSFPYAMLDRKLGAALGCVRGYVFTLIFLVVFQLHLFANAGLPNSYFTNLFSGAAKKLDTLIIEQQPEKYKEIYEQSKLYTPADFYRDAAHE